jgi:hypothetical protein
VAVKHAYFDMLNTVPTYKISGSHSSEDVDVGPMGCNAMQTYR